MNSLDSLCICGRPTPVDEDHPTGRDKECRAGGCHSSCPAADCDSETVPTAVTAFDVLDEMLSSGLVDAATVGAAYAAILDGGE